MTNFSISISKRRGKAKIVMVFICTKLQTDKANCECLRPIDNRDPPRLVGEQAFSLNLQLVTHVSLLT